MQPVDGRQHAARTQKSADPLYSPHRPAPCSWDTSGARLLKQQASIAAKQAQLPRDGVARAAACQRCPKVAQGWC